jgi:hypothetical protein
VDRRTIRRKIGECRWTGGQLGGKLMDRWEIGERRWTGGQLGGKLVNVNGQADSRTENW